MWPKSENTEQLLAHVRAGESDAVGKLLDRHREAVRRMIDLRMDPVLKRRVDASDLVQDVLIQANRRLDSFLENPIMPFHLWLRQMAKDRLIDAHRRHRGAARRTMDREQPLAIAANNESSIDLLTQLQDQEMTPATAATWNELQRRFHTACDKLDPTEQEIVLMRHFEQLTNGEAATALEISPQAASMRYLRAMRRLREML
ncbi:MAG: RNA polymerase factor sigma-70 [Planctomycetaceae bacterium]|nr:RNA polymerase factor sigma-70 [Planctomycetaceae bacterium]HCK40277.1 RNA polymerase factor sigma-70 [Planctomycetaceae bacterium]